jgi:hypothetical protein
MNHETGHENPLELARKYGFSTAGDLGAEAFPELELAYASGLLPRFSDNPLIRPRQNLLLYWNQSFLKTTLINEFAKTIPEDLGVIDITSMSPQMIFGSITEDRNSIVKPAFAGMRFVTITELLSFIGTGNTMRDIVNTMNKVMEGEVVTRQLLKLGQEHFDNAKIEKLKQKGVYYDPHQAQLSYQPDVCILAASRPLDNRTYTYLRQSGHLYRYHVLQHDITDEEAKRYFTENYYPDLELQAQLKTLNDDLARIAIKEIKGPPKPIMDKIVVPLEEIVKDEAEKQRLAEIIDIRTKGDIQREITAHAFIRTATETGFKAIEKLDYVDSDVEFILERLDHFVEFKINPLFVEEWTAPRIRKRRPRDQVKQLVLELFSDGKIRQRKEVDEYIHDKLNVGSATISNALDDLLLREHRICQPKYGFYKLREECKTCEQRGLCTSTSKNANI